MNNAVWSVQIFTAFKPEQVVRQMIKFLHEKYIYTQTTVQQNHFTYSHSIMLLKNVILIHTSTFHNINLDHASAQTVSHQPSIVAVQVQTWNVWWKNGNQGGIYPHTLVSPGILTLIPSSAPQSLIILSSTLYSFDANSH